MTFHVPNADNRFDRYNCLALVLNTWSGNDAQVYGSAAHHLHSIYPPPCPCQWESGDMVVVGTMEAGPLHTAPSLRPKKEMSYRITGR